MKLRLEVFFREEGAPTVQQKFSVAGALTKRCAHQCTLLFTQYVIVWLKGAAE